MGLLSRFPWMMQGQPMLDPSVTPFAPQLPQEGQGQGPAFAPPNKPPAAPQRSGWAALTGQQQPGATWDQRLNNTFQSPLFNLGLNLLAGSQNGGDWGVVAQGMNQYGQQQMQRQQLENAQRLAKAQEGRDQEQWSWMRDERARTAERRRLAQEYIASRPPGEQAELRMIDPDQLAEYIQQDRQYDLQLEEMRDNRAYRGASLALDRQRLEQDRLFNSTQTLLGRGEAERMNNDMTRLSNWGMVDNDLTALEEILQRNPAAFNQVLDGDQSVVLARVRDPTMRRDLNTIYAISANLAREELRGQTPVSNIDLLSAMRSNPNTQAGHLFVRDWLARARQDRERLQGSVQSRLQYMQQGDGRSLYEVDPTTGQNWYQSQDGFTRYGGDAPAADATAPRRGRERWSDYQQRTGGGAQGGDAAAAAAELQRREGGGGGGFGAVGGRADGPRLLREPRRHEMTLVREYERALQYNQTQRARALEVQMRRNGLIQ